MAENANQTTNETFVWTDDEAELLLRVTLGYKTIKQQENIDWESCQSKYSDIVDAFRAQYPMQPKDKDFPHDVYAITKAQVTAKVKRIRGKYRQAVDTGRRSGQGRVVLLFSNLCEEIWGGSPPRRSVDTGDLEESSSRQSSSPTFELSTNLPDSIKSSESPPPAVVKQRGDMLQENLTSRKSDRLKRKPPAESSVQEDMQIKKRILELMEDSTRRNSDNMQQINTNIANSTNTIQEGLSLMRQLLVQPHVAPPHGSSAGHEQLQGRSPASTHISPDYKDMVKKEEEWSPISEAMGVPDATDKSTEDSEAEVPSPGSVPAGPVPTNAVPASAESVPGPVPAGAVPTGPLPTGPVSAAGLVYVPGPSTSPSQTTPTAQKRARTTDETERAREAPLYEALHNGLHTPPPPSELELFFKCLIPSMERLPYRQREHLKLQIFKMVYEANMANS